MHTIAAPLLPTSSSLPGRAAATPSQDVPAIDAATLHRWLGDGQELALLDVREHGQYGEGHPFFAVHAAYSRLETEVLRLVPRRTARTVLLDNGDTQLSVAPRAARRLAGLGYTQVSVLAGGAPAWEQAGHTLFKGVNLPSKTFGECVEHAFHVPHLSARALSERLASGEPLVLLDGRTLEEHRKMTLPGALPVPNGELALRWRSLVHDTTTPIVVHCAGRTRSIVGAQILRDLGVPNPVLALENGTQGWALAGFELERGSTRALPPAPPAAHREAARLDAASAALRDGVPVLSPVAAQAWLEQQHATVAHCELKVDGLQQLATRRMPGAGQAVRDWHRSGLLLAAARKYGVPDAYIAAAHQRALQNRYDTAPFEKEVK